MFLFNPEKPGPLGQVRVLRLYLGVLCLKSQNTSTKKQTSSKLQAPNSKEIPNYKHQISNKSQIPSLKFQTRAKTIFLFFCLLFVFSVIGIYLIFVICYLGFNLLHLR